MSTSAHSGVAKKLPTHASQLPAASCRVLPQHCAQTLLKHWRQQPQGSREGRPGAARTDARVVLLTLRVRPLLGLRGSSARARRGAPGANCSRARLCGGGRTAARRRLEVCIRGMQARVHACVTLLQCSAQVPWNWCSDIRLKIADSHRFDVLWHSILMAASCLVRANVPELASTADRAPLSHQHCQNFCCKCH